MRTRRGTRLAIAVLAGTAALLGLLVLHIVRTPVAVTPIAPPSRGADASPPRLPEPATPLDGRTAGEFRETVSRPLFNPDRRPVERIDAAPAQPKAAPPANLRLVGVVKEGDQPPRALIRLGDSPKGKWVAEGAKLDGWTLSRVNEDSVIVKTGGRSQRVKLFIPRATEREAGQSALTPKIDPAQAGTRRAGPRRAGPVPGQAPQAGPRRVGPVPEQPEQAGPRRVGPVQ